MISTRAYLLLFGLTLLLPQFVTAQDLDYNKLLGGFRARQIGPAVMGGRVSSIDVVSKNPRVMYVGAAGGGVWKSISAGAIFNPIFDKHPQSIGKIAIDQNQPDIVWVGTGEPWVRNSTSVGKGIYKTKDGGYTWEVMGLQNTERIADIIIHPDNSDIVYVAALGHLWNGNEDRGVYKTKDGGKTWRKILYIDENTGCADLDIDPDNPDILYAAMWSFRRYPWSFDSGMKNDGGKSGLYKSVDGGGNWNTIHKGLPKETLGRMAIGVAPSNGKTIYLSVEVENKYKKGMYKSIDQGASWQLINQQFNTYVRPFYFSNIVVDPHNENRVFKCGVRAVKSEDGGGHFSKVGVNNVHLDVHDVWIDPFYSNHVLLATDGGVYESYDGAKEFRMFQNLPISQFYHVSVDHEVPYNIYGGLQDNGSWYGPSEVLGGIMNADWEKSYGGDGFYSFRHPTDPNIIYSEFQQGKLLRFHKLTRTFQFIRPHLDPAQGILRFNWNAPIHLSASNSNRLYFGAQYLFVSEDMGISWKQISDDLTTNDPEKQQQSKSGGLTVDNSGAENYCTIYAIAESPLDEQLIWVGTDDGKLQITENQGVKWDNVFPEELPAGTWISDIEPSKYDRETAYVTFDGHRTGDQSTYLFKTTDLGQSWTRLSSPQIEGYAHCILEDVEKEGLLFLGTELGLYISLNQGESWFPFRNNVPKVAIRDMVIQPETNTLVMGTHGRGVIVLDDLDVLRQVTKKILRRQFYIFNSPTYVLNETQSARAANWYTGAGQFIGPNPDKQLTVAYYVNPTAIGRPKLKLYDSNNKLIAKTSGGEARGVKFLKVPARTRRPKSIPLGSKLRVFYTTRGLPLAEGTYKATMTLENEVYKTFFDIKYKEDSPYSVEDRKMRAKVLKQLFNASDKLAYIYTCLDQIHVKLTDADKLPGDMSPALASYYKQIDQLIVSLCPDNDNLEYYEGETFFLQEQLLGLYGEVMYYAGRPTASQLEQAAILEQKLRELEKTFELIVKDDLPQINKLLKKESLEKVKLDSFDEFLQ